MNEESVAEVLALWTGIPVYKLTEEETAKLLRMEEELHKRIVGQNDAIKAVSQAIRRTRAGLKDPKRPSGSFIFLGPSGVGKTETAKTLAEFLFGDESSMIQLDMSEYMEKHTVSRLVGSPPGYVGYDEGGQLTEAVRRKPFSVVLFDEIEKAHPDVFNALLQILEDGRLTDAQGRTVDFKNTVIIMTSNLGTADLKKAALGFARADESLTYDKMKEQGARRAQAPLPARVPQPHRRRHRLPPAHHRGDHGDRRPADQAAPAASSSRRVSGFELTNEAKLLLAKKGYDASLGARPLRRAIQRLVEDPLAEKILWKEFHAGDTIVVDAEGEEIVFRTVEARRAAARSSSPVAAHPSNPSTPNRRHVVGRNSDSADAGSSRLGAVAGVGRAARGLQGRRAGRRDAARRRHGHDHRADHARRRCRATSHHPSAAHPGGPARRRARRGLDGVEVVAGRRRRGHHVDARVRRPARSDAPDRGAVRPERRAAQPEDHAARVGSSTRRTASRSPSTYAICRRGFATTPSSTKRLTAAGLDVNTLDAQLRAQLRGALHVEVVVHAPGGKSKTVQLTAGGHATVSASDSRTNARRVELLAAGALLLVLALMIMAASPRPGRAGVVRHEHPAVAEHDETLRRCW